MTRVHQSVDGNLLFHSYRDTQYVQYACDAFKKTLSRPTNLTQSMKRKGSCLDNAVAEIFFKTLKTKLVYHHQYATQKQVKVSILNTQKSGTTRAGETSILTI